MSISLDKMSLMRAFTTKRNRDAASPNVGRAASQRAGRPVVRGKISGPVALVSTSNELYINAEDVASSTLPEHVSSTDNSGEDSDASMLSLDTANMTETSSIDSPLTPELEPNHLSCYCKPAIDTNSGAASPSMSRKTSFETVPAIPQRMPSHSKKAHETLHRKRSVQRMMSPSATIRSSLDMFGNATRSPSLVEVPENSPFGNELAQLDVVAEEFSSTVDDVQNASDLTCMQKHDLAAFAASDYLAEIQDLIMESFLDETSEPVWI